MTDNQRRFVEEYLCDLNATAAAKRAGYSEKTAATQGVRLLQNAKVAEAIAAAKAARSERTEIKADRVLKEFARIGFADIRGLMKWDGDSVSFKPSADLTDDQAAAIGAVESETTTFTDAEGNSTTKIKLKLKLWDKPASLTQIGRHLQMFVDKVAPTSPDGTAPYEPMSEAQRAAKILEIIAQAQQRAKTPPDAA